MEPLEDRFVLAGDFALSAALAVAPSGALATSGALDNTQTTIISRSLDPAAYVNSNGNEQAEAETLKFSQMRQWELIRSDSPLREEPLVEVPVGHDDTAPFQEVPVDRDLLPTMHESFLDLKTPDVDKLPDAEPHDEGHHDSNPKRSEPVDADLIDHVLRLGDPNALSTGAVGPSDIKDVDGTAQLGLYHNGMWHLDMNGDRILDERDAILQFGELGDNLVIADLNEAAAQPVITAR